MADSSLQSRRPWGAPELERCTTARTRFCGVLAALVLVMSGAAPAGEPGPADVDAAVRKVVAETAVFVDECGKLFPDAKSQLDAALANWVVLKLPIPGVADVMKADSPERQELSQVVGPYLRRIPAHEREIECSGRYEMLLSKEPQLLGDSARLPPNVLDRYRR